METPIGQTVRGALGAEQTRDRMVRTARRVVGDRECEDVAHDAVVQALAAAGRFRADAQVGTWLHRIAVNAALMNHRYGARASRRLTRAREEATDARWLGHGEPEPSAAAVLEGEERRSQLRSAIARLPPRYRAVIELCVYDEREPTHVSTALGITPSAVRTRFSRAQDRLRKLMAG